MNSPASLPAIRFWTSRNDANHSNRHAECAGVEFFAFPYQPMLAKRGNRLATISDILMRGKETATGGHETVKKWSACVRRCLQDNSGKTEVIAHRHFPAELRDATDEDRDEAFRWLAGELNNETPA